MDMKTKPCDICGKRHRTLTRRQCLLGKRKNRGNPPGVLDATLREAVILRDQGECQRCQAKSDLHLSHVIRRSQCGRLRFEVPNVKMLCPGCHIWWHQNEVRAAMWFVEQWPDRWKYLQEKQEEYRNDPGTISMQWYLDQLEKLREYIAAEEALIVS